jgi:hypothetical protein
VAEWSIPFPELAKACHKSLELTIQKSCIFMFNRVIAMSPVDTGRFRGNWNTSIGAIDENISDRTDKTGMLAMSDIKSNVLKMKLGESVFFANALPYAMPLEYGWSQQAPGGMVRITVAEFHDTVEKAISETKHE